MIKMRRAYVLPKKDDFERIFLEQYGKKEDFSDAVITEIKKAVVAIQTSSKGRVTSFYWFSLRKGKFI